MSQDKEKNVHPIVERVLELAYQGYESVEFDEYAIEQIQELLRERYGKPDLKKAVVDLINLAAVLEESGSKKASLKLIIAVSSAADALKDQMGKNS